MADTNNDRLDMALDEIIKTKRNSVKKQNQASRKQIATKRGGVQKGAQKAVQKTIQKAKVSAARASAVNKSRGLTTTPTRRPTVGARRSNFGANLTSNRIIRNAVLRSHQTQGLRRRPQSQPSITQRNPRNTIPPKRNALSITVANNNSKTLSRASVGRVNTNRPTVGRISTGRVNVGRARGFFGASLSHRYPATTTLRSRLGQRREVNLRRAPLQNIQARLQARRTVARQAGRARTADLVAQRRGIPQAQPRAQQRTQQRPQQRTVTIRNNNNNNNNYNNNNNSRGRSSLNDRFSSQPKNNGQQQQQQRRVVVNNNNNNNNNGNGRGNGFLGRKQGFGQQQQQRSFRNNRF